MEQNLPTAPTTPQELADSSPTPQEAPEKPKKQTAAEARKELEDLKQVSAARMSRVRDLEVQAQKARTILKAEGSPGMTMNQDHYRLKSMIEDLRKLLQVEPEQIGG